MSPDDLAASLGDAIGNLAAQLDADRIGLVRLSGNEVTLEESHTFSRVPDGVVDPAGSTFALPGYAATLTAGRIVSFTEPATLPAEAHAEREFFERHRVRAHLAVPVVVSDGGRHALTATSFHEHAAWDEAAAPWLRTLALLFAAARDRALAQQQTAEALRFERLLADLSSSLATLEGESLVLPFQEVVRQVVLALGYDRGTVSELSSDGSTFLPVASWARPGIAPHEGPLGIRDLPWYVGELLNRRMVRLSRLPDQLPVDALPERAFVRQFDMRAHVAMPLVAGNDVIGFVGLASMTRYVEWPEFILNRLRTLASLMAGTIVRVRSRRQIAALAERLEAENILLRTEIEQERGFEEIVGKSAALRATLGLIAQVAPTDAAVLVTGETGTGKELVARAVHARSSRAAR
ncbi:MAG: GAF domain-containing protein, partial [Bacteroidales bacterium]